jgi:ribonuclease-3
MTNRAGPADDMTRTDDSALEERLGYRFKHRELLEGALTHSSAACDLRASRTGETTGGANLEDNERLEFLGDAVLELLTREYLLEKFPEWSEGQLSKSRARIVNARSLAAAARRLAIGDHLRLGRGEEKTGGREKPALLADAFEAVVAAIYFDGGLGAARGMLQGVLFEHAPEKHGEAAEPDQKSALQEFLQGRGQSPVEYRLAGESGPDHQKVFQAEVWTGGKCLASGVGGTKKEAEQRAARSALEQLAKMAARG